MGRERNRTKAVFAEEMRTSASSSAVDAAAFRPSVRQVLAVLLAAVLSFSLLGTNAFQALADETTDTTKKPLVYEDVYGLLGKNYALLRSYTGSGVTSFAVVDALGERVISFDVDDVTGETSADRMKHVASAYELVKNSLLFTTGVTPFERSIEGGKEYGFISAAGQEVVTSKYSYSTKSDGIIVFAGIDSGSRKVDAFDADGALLASIPLPVDFGDLSSPSLSVSGDTLRLDDGASKKTYCWKNGTTPVFTEAPELTNYYGDWRYTLSNGESMTVHRIDDLSDAYGVMWSCTTPSATFTIDARLANPGEDYTAPLVASPGFLSEVGVLYVKRVPGFAWSDGSTALIKAYDLSGNALHGFDDAVSIAGLSASTCLCVNEDDVYSVRDAKGTVLASVSGYDGYKFSGVDGALFGVNVTERKCIVLRYGTSGLTANATVDLSSLAIPDDSQLSDCRVEKSNITGEYCIVPTITKKPVSAPSGPPDNVLVATGQTNLVSTMGGRSGTVAALFDKEWHQVISKSQAQMNALLHAGVAASITDGRTVYPVMTADAIALGLVPDGSTLPFVYVNADLSAAKPGGYDVFAFSKETARGYRRVPSYVNADGRRITMVKDAAGKVGAVNATGNLVVPCEYEDCCALDGMPFALLKKDGAWVTSEAIIQASKTVHSSSESTVQGHVKVDTGDKEMPDKLKGAALSIKEIAQAAKEEISKLFNDLIGSKGSVPGIFEIGFVGTDQKEIAWNDETMPLTVTVALTDDMKGMRATCDLKVYHVNASTGAKTEMATEVGTDTLSFKTTHFSTYAVVAIPRETNSDNGTNQGNDGTGSNDNDNNGGGSNNNGGGTGGLNTSGGSDDDGFGSGGANDNTQTAHITNISNGTAGSNTSTAGQSTANSSPSLVKTGDATGMIVLIIFVITIGCAIAMASVMRRNKKNR